MSLQFEIDCSVSCHIAACLPRCDDILCCSIWCMILSKSWVAARWNYLQRNTSLVLFSSTSTLSTCTLSFCHLTVAHANNFPLQVMKIVLLYVKWCAIRCW